PCPLGPTSHKNPCKTAVHSPSTRAMTGVRPLSWPGRPWWEWLLRLRDDPDVRLRLFPLAEELLGLVVRDRAGDDHVLALLPAHRGRNLVLRRQLQRVDHTQHLVEVATGRHRVDEDQLDLLVGAYHEHVAYGLVVS